MYPELQFITGPLATLYVVSYLCTHLEHVDPRLLTLVENPIAISRFAFEAERRGAWCSLAKCLAGRECDTGTSMHARVFHSVEAASFDSIADVEGLQDACRRILADTWGRFIRFCQGAFSEKPRLKRLAVILAPSLTPRLDASVVCTDNQTLYIAALVHPTVEPRQLVDLVYHEVMHELLHGKVDEELEEKIIDALAPEGVLSKHLGLTERAFCRDALCKLLERYVENRLYEKG
ncbi:hypothetical protein Pyrfu_0323 [Pyrolobus fumarii 1A]|uniref:Uncharacterized protein n=1 Tax=Pyrolobus fumarii (strain DSM 11204 / 1A) TaxID=694429 RepID=G0EFM4_PYRF1|nr:hypothetical protein [Pyrolobus fumarii]AEM38195.1 hypothetical protein Pyrfu_0323 [Pyrolobus fumarii 1A]